jgi:excisionase family DNA binding protein
VKKHAPNPDAEVSSFPDRLTYPEAAQYLRRSPNTLRRDVMRGTVPCVKLFGPRGRVLFLRSDLEEFIQSHRVPAEIAG